MLKKVLLILSAVILFVAGTFAQDGATAEKKEPSVATTDAPKTSARFVPNAVQIKQGQTILKEKKLYTGEATGKYSDETRAAIRVYQKDNGLTLTGNFNRATLEKMKIELTDKQKGMDSSSKSPSSTSKTSSSSASTASTSSEGSKRPAFFKATDDQIKALQTKLKEAKLFSGEANGERSDELKAAVKKYQEANDLNPTGGINGATLQKMGIALTDKQKANVAAQKAYDAGKDKEKDSE